MSINTEIYAKPKDVQNLTDCHFYHTVDIPGYGIAKGPWDLRGGEKKYLGNVNVAGQRVLEMGTSSGFFCFYMEKQGADVVALDISPEEDWDVVPYARYDYARFLSDNRARTIRSNNAYWLCHKAFNSKTHLVHGTVYSIPPGLGTFDIATLGCILLHLRDPFKALQNVLALTRKTVIITDAIWTRSIPFHIISRFTGPCLQFLPNPATCEPKESWWTIPTTIIRHFIATLGFEDTKVSYHLQTFKGKKRLMYTVIGNRTVGSPV